MLATGPDRAVTNVEVIHIGLWFWTGLGWDEVGWEVYVSRCLWLWLISYERESYLQCSHVLTHAG